MAKTPRVINVGKSYLVYKGEEYIVENERVKKHTPDYNLPARKKPVDLGQVVAAYSEILHNNLSVSHRQQMMDKAEVKQRLAAKKAKNKKMTEKMLLQATQAEAILKTEFHLDDSISAANPLFRTRNLVWHKFFAWLSPLALYGHAFVIWYMIPGFTTTTWPFSSENQPLILILVLTVYLATLVYAVYWFISLTHEIQKSEDIKLICPFWFMHLLTILPGVGTLLWIISAGIFTQSLNRLIGRTKAGFRLGLLMALFPPLAHISIIYFQKRLNILDKNKTSFRIS